MKQGWQQVLEDKVPDKIRVKLKKFFCMAFSIVFEKGTGLIGKSYDKQKILNNLQIQNYAFQIKADRKSLEQVGNGVACKDISNMAIAAVEGVGLGVFGIGLPDIVIFIGMLLRSIYETALQYGFAYNTPEEQYFILKLMETAMKKGNAWKKGNEEIDRLVMEKDMTMGGTVMDEVVKEQIVMTSDAFAEDLLILKFIQGFPIVGVLGGCSNPIYYHKVMKYVRIKYQKRYLWKIALLYKVEI